MIANNKLKIWDGGCADLINEKAIEQARVTASMPFIHKHVALMPDAHYGRGSTVGSVIATKKALIPAAVGVDIGCGMEAVRLPLVSSQLPDNLKPIRESIEALVPVGRASHQGEDNFDAISGLVGRYMTACEANKNIQCDMLARQVGTLGGGNHFIELCVDTNKNVWIMLHSGSRGMGNCIGNYFIEKAKEAMHTWMIDIPDKDLSYLPNSSKLFDQYWEAVSIAQEYASINRRVMLDIAVKAVSDLTTGFDSDMCDSIVSCHHNYVSIENHFGDNVYVTRKGAVRARIGDLCIIPGSMGAKSFIARGLGNKDSFCSCSHGAGRVMSRMEAKRVVSLDEHVEALKGIECKKTSGTIDETPAAYKDIEKVMEAQKDLVEVVHELKQVMVIKG